MRKLVLFDLDNTLLPFHSYWEKANVEIFNSSSLTKNLNYESFINLYRKYDKELWELHLQQLISLDELRQQRLIKT
ncbi:hydrolase, partial [Priestia megaterium]